MDYELEGTNASAVEQFTNFNFAQAVVKILDNMGFSVATADALELLTGMMRRYFEDLCQRITVNKEHGLIQRFSKQTLLFLLQETDLYPLLETYIWLSRLKMFL